MGGGGGYLKRSADTHVGTHMRVPFCVKAFFDEGPLSPACRCSSESMQPM